MKLWYLPWLWSMLCLCYEALLNHGALLYFEIKLNYLSLNPFLSHSFLSIFLPIMIAPLEWVRSQCWRPGLRAGAGARWPAGDRVKSGESESGHSQSEWRERWPPELDTQPSLKHIVTTTIITSKDSDCTEESKGSWLNKEITQWCFDGGI